MALRGILLQGGLVTSVMGLVVLELPGLWGWILQLCDLPAVGMMLVLVSVPIQLLPTIKGILHLGKNCSVP